MADSGIYLNATFASLGFTPGTYTYSFGSGAHADSLVINAAASVPDGGATVALLGLGFVSLAAIQRLLTAGRQVEVR